METECLLVNEQHIHAEPNTQWLNRHCLKTRDEIFVFLVLWDLSDLFKSMECNGDLVVAPFLLLYLNRWFFFYPCTVFSYPPTAHTPLCHLFCLCSRGICQRSGCTVPSPGLWLRWLLAVLTAAFLDCVLSSVCRFYLGVAQGFWPFLQEFCSPMEVIAPRQKEG